MKQTMAPTATISDPLATAALLATTAVPVAILSNLSAVLAAHLVNAAAVITALTIATGTLPINAKPIMDTAQAITEITVSKIESNHS